MEIFRVVGSQFVFFSVIATGAYLIYRLVIFVRSYIPERANDNSAQESWDGVDLLYRLPSSIIGFLIMDYIIISFVVTLFGEGLRDLFRLDFFAAPFGTFTDGMDSALGLIGCAGIFGSTIFGIYQDHPPARFKILGCVAVSSALVGIGLRLS